MKNEQLRTNSISQMMKPNTMNILERHTTNQVSQQPEPLNTKTLEKELKRRVHNDLYGI
jgi:DNA topoisomerase IA